jgi:hypothetical protein
MRVVIKIRAGRDNPINKTRFDKRNNCGNPQTCRSQSAGQSYADGYIIFQHFAGKKPTRFTNTRRVIRHKRFVNQIRERCAFINWCRVNAFAA